MKEFTDGLQDAANPKDANNLSNKEAKDFLKQHGLKKIKKEDLFKFIQHISQDSENIESCAADDNSNIIIEYKDGTKETINNDKQSLIRSKTDENGQTTTTANKIIVNDKNERIELPVEESVIEANGKDGTATIYQLDTDGNPIKNKDGNYIPAQKTVISEEGQKTDVTTYENGIPKEETITKEGSKTVIQYDENGQPIEAVETQGEFTVKKFTYVDGQPREVSRIENKGQDTEKTTEFTYNEDGTVLENISELGGTKQTTRLTKDGKPQTEEIIESDKKTQRQYQEDGSATEIIREGENITQNALNPEGQRLTQVKVVDGKEYQLQYDGEGNTEGIIVQNGESPEAIAKKFGVPLDKLLEANSDKLAGKGKNQYFRVGDSIKIPREMEADEKVLQGRDSSTQAVEKYKKAMAAKAKDQQLRSLGLKNYQRAGEKFTYGGKEYKVLGTMKNRERILVQDAKGNISVASWDNKILKDSYVANTNAFDYGKKMKAADGKEYVVVEDRKDAHGRKIVVDANGKTQILSGGKSQTDFSDRVILRNDYVQASDAYDATGGSATITGKDGIKYVKDENGKVWYVDSKTGNFLVKDEYSEFIQQESNAISDKIYKAAKGLGTDEDKLKEGVGEIYAPEILARVNETLASKDSDYKGDSHTMPLEALILDEETHGNARPYFQTLINSGAMTTEQKGNTIARELKHEVEGGLGYTSTASVNEVMNLVPQGDRETRLAVESSLSELRPDLVTNEGSITRAYLAKDGWTAQEVDQFDSNWVANNSYQPGVDQEHRNGVIGRLCFDYDDKEALHKGLKACNNDPVSEDYQYLTQRAIEANKEKGYKTQFTDQEAVQTYLAGRSNNGGEVDIGQLSACNTLLFKASKPARVQAEEALYGAKNGDMSNVFESMDAEVYDSMAIILANGDIPGCNTIKDVYDKAMASSNTENKPSIKANAILSGHVEFTQEEISDFCIELMHTIDNNEGKGSSTGISASHTNDAEYQKEQLKAILSQHPEVIADVKAKVEAGDFKSVSQIITPGGSNGGSQVISSSKDTKAEYLDIINNTQCIARDEIFLDENGNKITAPTLIQNLKQRNMEALSQMREYVSQLEREFKMGVDEEGWLDNAGNALVRYSGIGTDRGDVANKYREAKRLLNQLEAAAQGKLRDSSGNVISAQQLAQSIIDKQDTLAQANNDYKSSVGMAKMGIVLAPVIVVTTVATAGTGAAGWAAVGVGAGVTATVEGAMYGTNLLTSETGNTAENRAAVTSQVLQDTALAAAGIKVGQYAENFAVNGIKAVNAAERTVFAPQTWKIISKVPEGKVKDFFGAVSKVSAKLEQASADVGASVISKQANLIKKFMPGITEAKLEKAAVILARGEAAGLEITSDTIQTLGQMYLIDGEFNEEGFIQGMIMSVAGNSIGHMTSLKSELSAAGKPKPDIENQIEGALNSGSTPKTPLLDGIIGDGNKASGIRLGAEKAAAVRGEIDQLLSGTELSGTDLANAYSKLNQIGNRDLRRELQGKITNAANGLTGAEKSAFQTQRALQLKVDVDKIVANKTVLEDADVRVINDYIKNENDITILRQLQEDLQQKRLQHRGTTANYDKLNSAIDKKIKSSASGEGIQGNGSKISEDDGKGAIVGENDGSKVGENDRSKVGENDSSKVGENDSSKVGENDGKGARVVNGNDNVENNRAKLLEDNGNDIKIEINGKTVEISGLKVYEIDADGNLVPTKSLYPASYFTNEINNPALRQAIADSYNGIALDANYVSRIIDLDQAMGMIDDVQMKQFINEEIATLSKSNATALDEIEFLVDAQNAFEARSAIIKADDYKNKSAIQRFNDYLKNDNLSTNELLNNPASSIHGNEVRGLKADIKLENRLYGIRQYMKQHPNSKISNHMYSKYLEELDTIGVDKSVINKCRRLNSEYDCKVMVSANLKEASEVMNYLEIEFDQWKAASGGQAKFPPVIDFSTVKPDWYDTGSTFVEGNVTAAYSETRYNGSLAFPGMSESGVAWAMRHEMTHTNDLKNCYNIPPQYDLNKIMPKKTKIIDGRSVTVPDFENCMFVDEFRKAGISESHIPYAYNNPAEFIAVAAEGDLSKCSKEFRQMLVDFGMPEWQLNMKPKTSVKTSADIISQKERHAFRDLEVNYTNSERGGILGFFNKLLGNDIREQGSFRYKPPKLETIAAKDFDISGIYIGNRVNVMGDLLEGNLPKNKAVIVAGDAKIRLADSWTLDLADPQIKKILDNLEEGRMLTVGRNGNIQCPSNNMRISGNHLEIRKVNGEIVIRDISKNGAEILGTSGLSRGVQLANRMKNYVSSIADVDIPQSMKNTWKKCTSEISDLANSFSMPDININTSAFKARYHSILNDLSTIASKVSTEVKQQLRQLMDKIKEMFNSFGISAKNNTSVNPNITGRPDLDKYVTPQNSSLQISKENREFARTFDVDESHIQFIQDNPELFKGNHSYGYWQGNDPADKHHGAWKMHMFSVDEADWQKMSQTLIPYLNEHGIEWKTLNSMHDVSHLNGDIQQGKAFTIYPRDNAHMEQVARDLDYIIRRNNLDIDASSIVGDRQMGGTGRLFYRYEFNTKQAQNEILDLSNEADYRRYQNLYDSNEGRVNRHGEGSYLADDMTAADDPWLNFDPSNTNSRPGLGQSVQTPQNPRTPQNPGRILHDGTNMPEGTRLPKGEGVTVDANTVLNLPNGIELDLSSPQIQALLNNLQNGQSISVGRNADNDIPINNKYVSGQHLTIQKQGNKFIVIDNSTNGTRIGSKLPELDENELVRVAGNNGRPIDANYIRTSREARSHLTQAIESGNYTRDLNSYIETINSMHEIAYRGKDGSHEWYSKAGQGSLDVNAGVIRNDKGGLRNQRVEQARTVEGIAKQYGDPYRVDTDSAVKLDGIPDKYLPKDGAGGYHYYPAGEGLEKYYYKEMHRTSKEALKLIESGASKQQIIEKLAEHYQYAANARPYGQINNSLFMNELNTLLTKAGMPTMPHGELDIAAMHLQPKTFKKYFADQYNKTALSKPNMGVARTQGVVQGNNTLDNSTNGTSIGKRVTSSKASGNTNASSPTSRNEKLNNVRDKILDTLSEELKDPDNVKEIADIIKDIYKGDYEAATDKILSYFGDKGYEKITGISYSDAETFAQDIANIIKEPTNTEHFMKLASDTGNYFAKQEGIYIDNDLITEDIHIIKTDEDLIAEDIHIIKADEDLIADNYADSYNVEYDYNTSEMNNELDYAYDSAMNDDYGILFNEAMPIPTPAQSAAPAKVSVLNDMESKYLPQYTNHPEATTNILNEITTKIKNGETPSKEMFDAILNDISAQTGIRTKELERDFERCFSHNILSSDWQGVQKALKTPEAKVLEDIENGGNISRKLDRFKDKRNLLSDTELQTKQ